MPEVRVPGVYVDETPVRAHAIEGVATSVTGFVGAARSGPIDRTALIASLGAFESLYGDGAPLQYPGGPVDNHLWNAARAFFEEGGKRLHIARAFTPIGDDPADLVRDCAVSTPPPAAITIRARHPGRAGNGQVDIIFRRGPNRLEISGQPARVQIRGACDQDIVRVTGLVAAGTDRSGLYRLIAWENASGWTLDNGLTGADAFACDLDDLAAVPSGIEIRAITATVIVRTAATAFTAADLALTSPSAPDAVTLWTYFTAEAAADRPIVIAAPGPGPVDGLAFLRGFIGAGGEPDRFTLAQLDTDAAPAIVFRLEGGSDGQLSTADSFAGLALSGDRVTGLRQFETIPDIAIVAAPGSTHRGVDPATAQAIAAALIDHAERLRYRIAILDSIEGHDMAEVRAWRRLFDTSHAALYYPWVRIIDPFTNAENIYPPSGFVAGIFARNDIERGVHKAPANEVVTLALGFETAVDAARQDILNPEGINCFRFFEGRGNRLWGARTLSSDPDSKYVNVRRYLAYLEHSIAGGLQWTVLETNGEALWADVRRLVGDFLLAEWQTGALLGTVPDAAFFVKCDRTTMTQNDLDNGRLICQIGIAPLRPAEFIIIRIAQSTADRRA